MFAQLPPPHPAIAPAAYQLRLHQPAVPKHPIPVQHSLRARPLFFRSKKREDRRAAPGHSNTLDTKTPQPCRDFPELGILPENDRLEIVRAERTRRPRAAPTFERAHEGLETINAT